MHPKTRLFILFLLIALLSSVLVHFQATNNIYSTNVEFQSGDHYIKAVYMVPKGEKTVMPGIVVTHGFSGNKEMMRPISEGLVEQGFAVLAIDAQGHGMSSGKLRSEGNTSLQKDGLAAVEFLKKQPEVSENEIGMVGHSLGAGLSYQTSLKTDISSMVIIGNDLESVNINSTHPKNLLMAIGKYEELASVESAMDTISKSIGQTAVVNTLYGSFETKTARKIIVPNTDHLFEVGNPIVIEETINWMLNSFHKTPRSEVSGWAGLADAAISAFSALMWIALIPLSFHKLPKSNQKFSHKLNSKKHGMFFFISFMLGPIGIGFGFSAIFFVWYLIGSLIFSYLIKRSGENPFEIIKKSSFKSDFLPGMVIIFTLFLIIQIILHNVTWDFRYVIPIFSKLSLNRFFLFLGLWSFGTAYFIFEQSHAGSFEYTVKGLFEIILARTWVFLIILLVQFVPIFLFGTPVLPGIFGFLTFFILALIPVMILISIIQFYSIGELIHPITTAIIIAGLIGWDLASTLPIN